MARGFESKDVEFQQAEAERRGAPRRALTPAEREHADRRHSVELALTRARRELVTCALFISLGLSLGCGSRESTRVDESSVRTETTRPASPRASRPRIVALGDSLTAGLGLDAPAAYPALLQTRLTAEGFAYDVVNAGVSGDTSAGGLSRLDWALDGDVRVLIVALGGNDGLRALPPEELEQNLATIIEKAQARHITVILAGMEAPPNFGRDYIVECIRNSQLGTTWRSCRSCSRASRVPRR